MRWNGASLSSRANAEINRPSPSTTRLTSSLTSTLRPSTSVTSWAAAVSAWPKASAANSTPSLSALRGLNMGRTPGEGKSEFIIDTGRQSAPGAWDAVELEAIEGRANLAVIERVEHVVQVEVDRGVLV